MNIGEASAVNKLLDYLLGGDTPTNTARAAAVELAGRANLALGAGVTMAEASTWLAAPTSGQHSGRSFVGTEIEDACPCPQEPCGLVDYARAHPDCEHHPIERRKTMRQIHDAQACAARQASRG